MEHKIKLTEAEEKAFSYIATNTTSWIENAAKNRARLAKIEIVKLLVEHCNKHNIQIEKGEDNQVFQAFKLGIVEEIK